jgi:hypothetical protein
MMRPLRNGAVGFAIPSREPNAPQSTMSLLALVWQRLQAPPYLNNRGANCRR